MNHVQCFFCGGRDCKWERAELWESVPPGIDIAGLYCNWVTDNILASQRPSTRLIREHNLLEKWKAFNIWSVVNLQEHGEHALCGDGIEEESGFAYLPEELMDAGIYYYNFGWRDMGIPPLETMLNIVQVIEHTLDNGRKTLVHCHAGLGRTGLAIACYLVYGQALSADTAIAQVRKRRPLAIQTRRQVLFVHDFENFLSPSRIIFPYLRLKEKIPLNVFVPDTLTTIIEIQRQFCHGSTYRILKYIPKVVYALVKRVKALITGNSLLKEAEPKVLQTIDHFDETLLLNADLQSIQLELNKGQWSVLENETDIRNLVNLLLIWIVTLRDPFISTSEQSFVENASEMRSLLDSNVISLAFFYSINWILEIIRPFQMVSEKAIKRTLKRLAYICTQTVSYALVKPPSSRTSYGVKRPTNPKVGIFLQYVLEHYQVSGDDTRPISVFHPDEVLSVVSLVETHSEERIALSRESADENRPPQSALSRRLSQVRTTTRQSRRQSSSRTPSLNGDDFDIRKDEQHHRRKPSMIEEEVDNANDITEGPLPKTPAEPDRISLRNRYLLSAGALGVSTDLRENVATEEKDDEIQQDTNDVAETALVLSSETDSLRPDTVETPFPKMTNYDDGLATSSEYRSVTASSNVQRELLQTRDTLSLANTSSLSLPNERTVSERSNVTSAWSEKQQTPRSKRDEKTLQRHIEEFSQDAPPECLSDGEWEQLGRLCGGSSKENGWKVDALWMVFCAYGRSGIYEKGRPETVSSSKRISRLVTNLRTILDSKSQ